MPTTPSRAMPDEVPIVKYPARRAIGLARRKIRATPGTARSTVKGAASGKLKGKVVALKDNIMLAGVPMMNGASTLEGYVPDIDATIVTRMLDAGGDDRRQGALRVLLHVRRQPHQRDRRRCTIRTRWATRPAARRPAAPSLVALGEVDMAIGGDQGGSIRMPASFCGIYGMKPTLWAGALHRHHADRDLRRSYRADDRRTSPTTRCCSKCIAGPDGYDPRQIKSPRCRTTPRRSTAASRA